MSVMSKEGLLSGEFAWQHYATVYPKAVNIMRKMRDLYDDIFSSVDVIVMPTTLSPANRLPAADAKPLAQIEAAKGMTENTCSFNATGHPALAMPIGFVPSKTDESIRLPASMQIVGRWHDRVDDLTKRIRVGASYPVENLLKTARFFPQTKFILTLRIYKLVGSYFTFHASIYHK